ncbi:30S ribosomal protein THX [Salinimicrobium oceani]|uniref:30S ribosomal protein THX n=1 Tax=Salinimicrobium oceani TaxID=2722702 RepID=A0ABX1CY13_9FLAO|nr:30S ribosomal protein THX [Salinimicrobium oceani]NJW51834.1 30S ribosomal protein THX [Salinimicrobium oceani]
MCTGEKKTKGGKIPVDTFGKLRTERGKFTTKPQQIKDPLEKLNA